MTAPAMGTWPLTLDVSGPPIGDDEDVDLLIEISGTLITQDTTNGALETIANIPAAWFPLT